MTGGEVRETGILDKLALRGRTGSKYYNPGQADGYTETNLQRYLDLTVAPPAAALGCVERIL